MLTLSIVDTQAKQRRSLTAEQRDLTGGQVQLEDRRIHVLRPKDEITIMGDSERVVELFPVVHHLQDTDKHAASSKPRGEERREKKKSIILKRALAV